MIEKFKKDEDKKVNTKKVNELVSTGNKILKIMYILFAIVLIYVLGLIFKDAISSLSENIKIIGGALIVTSLFLFIIKDFKGKKDDNEITYKDALIIGLFQCVALLPGISRSGATIVGAMLLKFKRETAFKFSFMLYIPISLATIVLGVKDIIETGLESTTILYYLIGMVVASVITYFSTKLFKDIMKKGKLIWFVLYCLIVGTLVLIFL